MEGCAPPHRCLAGDGASPRPLGGSTRPIGCHLGLFLAPTRAAALRAPKSYSPSRREGSHSRKLTVASPPPTYRFIALRAVSPRNPAAFWRDIATPAARICCNQLQIVAAELPENLVLCSPGRAV